MAIKFHAILSKLLCVLAGQSILLLCLFCTPDTVMAANIDLTIFEDSHQNRVDVTIINRSFIPVLIQEISIGLNNQSKKMADITPQSVTQDLW